MVSVQWGEAQVQVWEGGSWYCGLCPVPHFLTGKRGDEEEEGVEGLGEGSFQADELARCVTGPPCSSCYAESHSQDSSHGIGLFH